MVMCEICGSECRPHATLDFDRSCDGSCRPATPSDEPPVDYVLCGSCGFCFAPQFRDWSPGDFSGRIYNGDYVLVDPDYVERRPRANAKLLDELFGARRGMIRHLDYGGGNGALSKMLGDAGWDSACFDPHVKEGTQSAVSGRFDLVTAFEVFEHVAHPQELAAELAGLLDEEGLIFFSTLVSDGHIAHGQTLDWWYAAPRNGHISLFSRNSLELLGASAGLQYAGFSENLHVFWKRVPPWAEHLIRDKTGATGLPLNSKNKMHDSKSEFNRLAQTRHGPMLYNRFDKYVGGSLAAYGEFSEGEAAMFGQLIGPGAVVVEAGANIGAHTVHLARLVGESGSVYAFEPQRIVFQTLCANLALNQLVNVVARQQGAGRQAGQMALPNADPRVENNFGGLSLLAGGQGEKVGIVTIDSLELSRCNLIKADVEGMEEEVIAGAVHTIARHRPLLYLENDRVEKSASLIAFLQSLGYRIWWHLSPLFNPDNFAGNSRNIFGNIVSINILCQPAESARPVAGLREVKDANERWDRQS